MAQFLMGFFSSKYSFRCFSKPCKYKLTIFYSKKLHILNYELYTLFCPLLARFIWMPPQQYRLNDWPLFPSLQAIHHSLPCCKGQDCVPFGILNKNWFFLSTYSLALWMYSIKFVRYDFASEEVCWFLPRVIFILYFTNSSLQKSCYCFLWQEC